MSEQGIIRLGIAKVINKDDAVTARDLSLPSPWVEPRPLGVVTTRRRSTVRPGDLFGGQVTPLKPLLSATLFPITVKLLLVSVVLIFLIAGVSFIQPKRSVKVTQLPFDQALDLPTILAIATLPPEGKALADLTPSELLGVLLNDQETSSRLVESLEFAATRRIPGLAEAGAKLLDHQSGEVRTVALSALAATRDRRVLPAVLLRLDDADPTVRLQAAHAIASVGDRTAVDFLTYRFVVEKDLQIKAALKSALERLSGLPVDDANAADSLSAH